MAGERQVKQEVAADPFQGLMDSLLPGKQTVTTLSSPYTQQLADVLAAQQAAYSGGNAAAQQAIVDLVARQTQGQRAGIEARTKAAGGYNSAAQRLAKDRVDAEAANKAALQVAQLNQAERNNASSTASNLSRASQTQTVKGVPAPVSDVLKALAISQGVRAVPALIDMVSGAINQDAAAASNPANQLGEITINGVTYDNPNAGLSKVLGPASSGLSTAGAFAGGPVGMAVGGLVQKYGPSLLGKLTGTTYATPQQWDELIKNNPQAVQAAMQQAGLASADVAATGAGAGMNPSMSAFNMPETSYSLDLGLPSRASPAAFNAISMTPAGELFGSSAFDVGQGAGSGVGGGSPFDFTGADYSLSPASSPDLGSSVRSDGSGSNFDFAGGDYSFGGGDTNSIGGGASGSGLRDVQASDFGDTSSGGWGW